MTNGELLKTYSSTTKVFVQSRLVRMHESKRETKSRRKRERESRDVGREMVRKSGQRRGVRDTDTGHSKRQRQKEGEKTQRERMREPRE